LNRTTQWEKEQGIKTVLIRLTNQEFEELERLRETYAGDNRPGAFRKKALLTGGKFIRNSGRKKGDKAR